MSNYLEGYVRARQTLAEIERGRLVIGRPSGRPDSRALKRWLGNVASMARRTVTSRPVSAARGRLSGT